MFVLFDTASTRIVRILRNRYWQDAKFASEGAAKAAATRLVKAGKLVAGTYSVLSYSDFAKVEKTEVVTNLMSGKQVVQSVNTPLCCDVSRETYWSM